MPPPVLATSLIFLLQDADEEINTAARKSLTEIPEPMATGFLKGEIHPMVLDFFGRERFKEEGILERVLLNRLTPDDTFVFLGERVPERFVNMMAQNHVRLLRVPAIAEALKKNPNVCFEFDVDTEMIEADNGCDWGVKFKSVVGFGRAVFLDGFDDKREALNIVMGQYSKRSFSFPDHLLMKTAVIKIKIDNMTGKQSGF